MKKIILSLFAALGTLFTSCGDDIDLVIPYPTNITFEELEIPTRFSHVIPDNGFSVQGLNFRTVKAADGQLAGGFCYSNRSNRSFVWQNTPEAIDYLVCHVAGDDAYFTLDKARTIDYMLVANTTWVYLATTYGDTYGTEERPVVNPNIPSKPKGVWHTYVPGGVKRMAKNDYFTLTVKGYKGNTETGTISFDLVCKKGHNADYPAWDYTVTDWRKLELSSLGEVDKVVFYLDSSDKEGQVMRTPSWFCLDGIQLKQ